jgi:predicted nucleotidyltransferase component of viral defense system
MVEDLPLASLEDIAAMKLAAITGRGRKRDFIDLFFLLSRFSLETLLNFYRQKYPEGSDLLVLRSLTYFADAMEDPNPQMIKPITWTTVQEKISSAVRQLT